MRQRSLSDTGFDKYSKKTRKQRFLEEMEVTVPWRELVTAIEPYYHKPESAGPRPVAVERTLRIHLLQHWFNLSDPAAQEAPFPGDGTVLYDLRKRGRRLARRTAVRADLARGVAASSDERSSTDPATSGQPWPT